MGAFSESSFADVSAEFNGNGVKPLRLVWHAFLRASKPAVAPSKFADFSRHVVSLLPLKAPLPPFKKPAAIFLSDITRFAKPRPLGVAVAAVAAAEAAPAPVVIKKGIDFAKAAARAQNAQTVAASAEILALESVVAKIIANENVETPVADAPAVVPEPRKRLSLKAKLGVPAAVENLKAQAATAGAAAAVAEQAVPRKTLSLKTKVELPPIAPVSARASSSDLAAAFKAEMKLVTEQQQKPEAQRAAPAPKYRSKSWGDMIAEAEKPAAEKKWGVDLASAFKREMQAAMAEIEPQAQAAPAASKPAAPKPPRLAA